MNDDQPYEIRPAAGPLVSVPYTLELNDIPMMVIQHHTSDAGPSAPVRPALRGRVASRVMALDLRPHASVVPHRIKHFEAVYDYMRKQQARLAHDRRGDVRVVAAGPPVVVSERDSALV